MKLSNSRHEFINSTNSSHISMMKTRSQNGNGNDDNVGNCYSQTSREHKIKIEVTRDLRSRNLCTSNIEKKYYVKLAETNTSHVYCCAHCEKEYKTKRSIVRHFENRKCSGKLWQNDEADRKIVKTKIWSPEIVGLSDKKYKCRHCERSYTQKNNLFRHIREDHVQLAEPTNCNFCNKVFFNHRKLQQHMRCHSGKPYECSVCLKKFSQLAHVHSHMFTHTGEKPYQCHICERSFSKSFNLKTHILRHNGEKQFNCRECPTGFFTHGELEKHVRIHTAERPYSCNTCFKCFKQNSHLKKHILSHTGQRPFKCLVCRKSYVNSSHLKAHTLSHTKEILPNYTCSICGDKFSKPITLKRHIAEVHRRFTLIRS